MAHRPGYLGTTDHLRGEPGTERRKRRRPRAGTPTREQNRRRRTAEPGPRRPRRPEGRETDRRTPRRTRCSTAETADSARTPSQRWQRTGGNRVVAGGGAPRAGTATPRPARPQLPRSSRLLRRRAIKRTRLQYEYNAQTLTCQGVAPKYISR